MALQRDLYEQFVMGSVLMGPPDMLPQGAIRFGQNVRVDRERHVITSRPGVGLIATAPDAVRSLSQLYHADGTVTTYGEAGGTLLRNIDTGSPTIIDTGLPAGHPTTAVNMVDGENDNWTYFAHNGPKIKDNGTVSRSFGIAPPANPPLSSDLATDLSTSINTCENAGAWTGTGLVSGPSDESSYVQQGSKSMVFVVGANTVGIVAIGSLGGGAGKLNLDTLAGGDATVKNDDYLFFWFLADRPDRVVSLQVDIDLDTQTVGNAFVTNFYSIRLAGITRLNQGPHQWTKIQVRKSEFQAFGTAGKTWADAKSIRFSVLASTDGDVTCYLDDIKLRGGTDIEGDVEYTVAYRNSVTGGRGNPPLDGDGHVRYTAILSVDRQRVNITTTNVRAGGADTPADAQLDTLILYRRINGGFSVKIDEIEKTASTPYLDTVSVAATLLNETIEDTPDSPGNESENDFPPTGTEVLFGPGATNRLFALVGNVCYFSKVWQAHENRAENWPPLNNFIVAGGSELALTGLATDTQIIIWTNRRTYQVLGSGADTYLPVPIPNSRPIVGRKAMTEGDGRIFFFAPDGLWQQVGLAQAKLVDMGETLQSPEINMVNTPGALAAIELAWHADTRSPMLMATVSIVGRGLQRLVVKKNAVTQQYTDVFLDTGSEGIVSLYEAAETNRLLGGGSDGGVYLLEDHERDTDDSGGIEVVIETPAHHQGAPPRSKQYGSVVVESNTHGEALTVELLYDKSASRETVGTLITTTPVGMAQWSPGNPLAFHQNVALRLSGTVTQRVAVYRYGFYYLIHPEALTYVDTGVLAFPKVQLIQRCNFTLDAPGVVTIQPYYDEVPGLTLAVEPTHGQEYRIAWVAPGSTMRTVRFTLASPVPFRLYDFTVRTKLLAGNLGYQETSLLGNSQASVSTAPLRGLVGQDSSLLGGSRAY